MKQGWFDRFVEVVENGTISKRSLSLSAKRGPNFVSQMINDRKQPSFENLTAVIDQFSSEEAVYILLGIKLNEGDLEFLKLYGAISPSSREHVRGLIQTLQASVEYPKPDFEQQG